MEQNNETQEKELPTKNHKPQFLTRDIETARREHLKTQQFMLFT